MEEISKKQIPVIDEVVGKQTKLIILKIIDENRKDPGFIKKF